MEDITTESDLDRVQAETRDYTGADSALSLSVLAVPPISSNGIRDQMTRSDFLFSFTKRKHLRWRTILRKRLAHDMTI